MFPDVRMHKAYALALDKKRAEKRPVVLVQMDNVKGGISCDPTVPNLVPFVPVLHGSDIKHGNGTWHRSQYPLVPAQATTLHKAQGLTAHFGAVMEPEQNKYVVCVFIVACIVLLNRHLPLFISCAVATLRRITLVLAAHRR